MSKLVDKEKLAKLAAALDARAKAAVKAEEERAMAAEQAIDAKADANAAAIAAINHAETGILKQAQDHAQGLVDGEKDRAEEAEGLLAGRLEVLEGIVGTDGEAGALGEVIEQAAENAAAIAKLNGGEEEEGSVAKAVKDAVDAEKDAREEKEAEFEGRIAANEAFVAAQPAVDEAQDARIKALEDDAPVKQAAIEAAQDAADAAQADVDAVEQRLDAEGGLVDRIEANEAAIGVLNGDENQAGSVAAAVKAEADRAKGVEQDHEGRIAANEAFVAGYDAKEAKVREDFAAADAQVLADAQKYADDAITALVDSAPEAMNTLNELAEAIKGNKDVYDAYVEQHAEAMAAMKKELQDEIDADVKVVADAFAEEKERVAGVEADFEARIKANEDFVAAQPAVDAEQDRRLGVLEASVGEGGATAEAIQAAQDAADAAQDAADAAQADVDAIEERLDAEGGLVDRLEAAEAFVAAQPAIDEAQQEALDDHEARIAANEAFVEAHSHEAMEKDIQDLKDAVAKEVEDRDAAIAEALEPYSTTEEMKAVIGNVVNSLSLTIENDKVVLKLGGADGIELTSVDLDLVTDADIDAMIAGLDAPAAE